MTNPMSAKIIKSLHQKKNRQETKKFLVEGTKNVAELLRSDYTIDNVYITTEFKKQHADLLTRKDLRVQLVDASELKAYGTLEHNDGAIAIAIQKPTTLPKADTGTQAILAHLFALQTGMASKTSSALRLVSTGTTPRLLPQVWAHLLASMDTTQICQCTSATLRQQSLAPSSKARVLTLTRFLRLACLLSVVSLMALAQKLPVK